MEDVLKPGLNLVYKGWKSASKTSFILAYPNIVPSQHYRVIL